MATYKGIQGFTIQNLSADPSNPIEGQVWYNSTSNVWKVEEATAAGAWATGNAMSTARVGLAGAGTQTAALGFGGYLPGVTNATEAYDGSSWSGGGNLGTARYVLAGTGTQTAALAFGGDIGSPTGATEEYDGTNWATSNPLNTARRVLGGAGTQTAALGFGGTTGSPTGATEEYDGTSWTNNPTGLNTIRAFLSRLWNTNRSFSFWWFNSTYYSSNRRI
jgi:hypothetical protein